MQSRHIARSWIVAAVALLQPACADGGSTDVSPGDSGGVDSSEASPALADDAVILSAKFPDRLGCGETATATVVVQNTGSATWTRAGGYKLAAATDSDPLHPGEARVQLVDGESVIPGATRAFEISLLGPATVGKYTARWQMVHELVARFGIATSHDVLVDCAGDGGVGDAADAPDAGPTSIDLSTATVLNSPSDIATWAETAKITTLDLQASGVYIDFTKRDGAGSWPDVAFITPGENLEYTLWIVIDVGGKWYTSGCIQYWRGLDRNGGPPSGYAKNWYYDAGRWGVMTGHQPAVGEKVGFFVAAGNHRNVTDHSTTKVLERSNVVVIPFPADTGAVFKY